MRVGFVHSLAVLVTFHDPFWYPRSLVAARRLRSSLQRLETPVRWWGNFFRSTACTDVVRISPCTTAQHGQVRNAGGDRLQGQHGSGERLHLRDHGLGRWPDVQQPITASYACRDVATATRGGGIADFSHLQCDDQERDRVHHRSREKWKSTIHPIAVSLHPIGTERRN